MAFFEGGGNSRIRQDIDDVNKRFDNAVKNASTDSQKRNLEIERSETLRKVSKSYGQKSHGGFVE